MLCLLELPQPPPPDKEPPPPPQSSQPIQPGPAAVESDVILRRTQSFENDEKWANLIYLWIYHTLTKPAKRFAIW